jgi:hypothetical protein
VDVVGLAMPVVPPLLLVVFPAPVPFDGFVVAVAAGLSTAPPSSSLQADIMLSPSSASNESVMPVWVCRWVRGARDAALSRLEPALAIFIMVDPPEEKRSVEVDC